jgi:hypothetical protein
VTTPDRTSEDDPARGELSSPGVDPTAEEEGPAASDLSAEEPDQGFDDTTPGGRPVSEPAEHAPRLSWTLATVVYKVLVPALVVLAVGLLVVAWLPGMGVSARDLGIASPLEVPLVGLFPFALLAWFGARLKDVQVGDRGLIVSNFLRRTVVPYSQIRAIRQAGLLDYYVTLTLETPCVFGRFIRFFAGPSWLIPRVGGLHPAVFWLARRCGHTRIERGWLGGRHTSRPPEGPSAE